MCSRDEGKGGRKGEETGLSNYIASPSRDPLQFKPTMEGSIYRVSDSSSATLVWLAVMSETSVDHAYNTSLAH